MVLTIDAILSKKFDKAMGGYRQDDVDAFLQQIAMDFQQLQNENQDLEDKLEILAEKIEQYRKDETGLKTALIGAQKLGEGLLKDAKRQVEQMRHEALHELEATKLQLERDIQREKYELSHLQKETLNFKNRLMSMYVAQMDIIRNIPVQEETMPSADSIQEEKQAASPPVQEEILEPEDILVEPEPAAQPPKRVEPPITLFQEDDDDEADEEEPTLVYEASGYNVRSAQEDSRFGPLKFGEGFEVANLPEEEEPRKKFTFKKNR